MPALAIAVFSDVICPWCYLGKRRLESALDRLGLRETTTVTWLPYELNPAMPPEGMERMAYREAKFGLAKAVQLDAQMTALGEAEGVAFAFGRQTRTPSTRRAHKLIAHATRLGNADPVVEALFHAYFEEARDIGDPAVLREIAAGAGLDRDAAMAAMEDDLLDRQVAELEAEAGESGISGVPFFIIDGQWAVSGAQPPEQWVEALTGLGATA
ncbi:DsbA family oxidoreductase [Salinarimonas soli]|uniref:DsbA family oxidoreductase n=1 Tax=Salinarimonas soli TaxID=1638099 RepID=A0A5B2V3E2_9HYPH|nr:DsbA family oxidoreductase [Salinarimonas soli]KAA2233983.1 DsbA family oxidoreductase [Salinarimonas soli]